MSTAGPPAGWYPDQTPGQERYWDGTAWTAASRPGQGYGYPPPSPASTRSGGALADYGPRVGGWLIDWVIVAVASTPFLVVFHALQHSHNVLIGNGTYVRQSGFSVGPKGILIHALIVVVYGTLMCGSTRGQTLGMMVTKVRVADIADGGPIGFPRAFGRALLEYILALAALLPWVLDMLFPLWNPARQTLHDKATRTVVITTS